MDVQNKPAHQHFELTNFTFQDGTTLPVARLAYLDINPTGSKVALIPTCFRGTLYSTQTFAQGALQDHRIIVIALFGNGESSSPSNSEAFPKSLDYRDCVRAQHELLTHLGIQSIDVAVGFSMGGQTVYHWSVMYPDMVRNAVVICSSARTSGHNKQFLEGPSSALENAADYVGFESSGAHKSPRGIRAFAKAYSAWLTSAEWFDQELYKNLGYSTLSDWDETSTGPGYEGSYPNNLLAKLRMWQRGDISLCSSSGSSSLEETLSQIKARVLLMPGETDQYFRPSASEREVQHLKQGTLQIIPSVWGHLAGAGSNPVDNAWVDARIAAFLQDDTEA